MIEITAPSRRYLPALAREVGAGETVTVDDDTGRSLIEQGWKPAKPPAAKKATGKTTTTTTTAPDPGEEE